MNVHLFPCEIPTEDDCNRIQASYLFQQMEAFSGDFLTQHADALAYYNQQWCDDPLHAWSRRWEYPWVYQQIFAHLDGRPARILDAGSGITFFGLFLERTLGAEMTYWDHDPSIVDTLRAMGRHAEYRDLSDASEESASFDVVYCISVLEHTPRPLHTLASLLRAVTPGGLFVCTVDIPRVPGILGAMDMSVCGMRVIG